MKEEKLEEKKKTNKKFVFIFGTLIIVGLVYGIYKYVHSLGHESTDDAQVEMNMNPIIPRVAGYVTKVYVKDNDFVKKGDTLLVIDDKDFVVKVEDAKAALVAAEGNFAVTKADVGSAEAGVSVSEANVQSAGGNIETARIRLNRAESDYNRYKNLYDKRSITKQQFEQAEATYLEAKNQVAILREQQRASQYQRSVSQARTTVSGKQTDVAAANINRAKAALASAELNLGYTVITAAVDGQVSKVSVQPGQLVQPGQSLFYLINNSEIWVVANFKETQLDKMAIGQKVSLGIDAFPDTEFHGELSSFSPATGAKFSLLPPDNATGNFVKTIQRLPVKIIMTKENDAAMLKKLRPGMNVEVDVHLK